MVSNWTRIQIGILLLLFFGFSGGVGLYTDYLWFQSMGYSGVFLTILKSKAVLALAGAALFFAFAFLNAYVAGRSYTLSKTTEGDTEIILPENINTLLLGVIAGVSLLFGLGISASWEMVLKYLNREPFGIVDPLFGRDIGFFIFELPFYEAALRAGFFILAFSGVVTLFVYLLKSKSILFDMTFSDVKFEVPQFTSWAKTHLLILLALLFLLLGVNYHLKGFELLLSSRSDSFFGPGDTDITVVLPALKFLIFLSLLTALSLVLNIWMKRPWISAAFVVIVFAVQILGLGLYAGLVQEYRVLPNEIKVETPYIKNNIEYTAKAFNLEDVSEQMFNVTTNLTAEDITNNAPTIDNIRLWDPRPLADTYGQIQEIRHYYEFNDVDVDRYTINGDYVQLMLSARELDTSVLDPTAQNWINEHLYFTHGYGVVASPVNVATTQGLPELLIKDIPPSSQYFSIDRPEIYFGERTDNYVIVNTGLEEFDYPAGDLNQFTTYSAKAGVVLSSYFRKLAMATRFGTTRILFSKDITSESRILFNRNILTITNTIAPFLFYDRDPYIVVTEGRLKWILDGYTTSNRYPYSTPLQRINYIRNPVKVVVDAYTGETDYYLMKAQDPIINTYSKVFPGLFKLFSEMPQDLKSHMRYPEDMFSIQAEVYSKYHMKDPRVFYNLEDKWDVPNELYESSRIKMKPYFIIMKLPGEEKEEFILMLPFTPRNKDNMIAWMYGRSDPENYGKLGVFKFTKKELIFGPAQIEARIDQDEKISEQLTLWGQVGSRVIRGNLLVIPIEDSILYVEPLYLLAEQSQLPELKRVIVAYGDRIVMEESLDEAFSAIFGTEIEAPPPSIEIVDDADGEFASRALQHYNRALEELKALEAILNKLKESEGQ